MFIHDKPRVVIVTTAPKTLQFFFVSQIRFLMAAGFDVHTISSPGIELDEFRSQLPVQAHEVRMERSITPLADLAAVLRLVRKFIALRPAIVHTHTPKAGLLGMIAATFARVPVRIYTMNGLRFSTCRGLKRALMIAAEKLAGSLAPDVFCVSRSVRQEAILAGVCRADKVRTLGNGGSHGIDPRTFDPDRRNSSDRQRVRAQYGLPASAVVLGYIGRVVRDKGMHELLEAWRLLQNDFQNLWLLICGPLEAEDPLAPDVLAALKADGRIRMTAETVKDIPAVYAAIDIFVLPSYREGLPNVALEAQAMRVPIVATRISGTVDAVKNGTTGVLVEVRNPVALAGALRPLIEDGKRRLELGLAGRAFVGQYFLEDRLSELLAAEYRTLVARRSNPGRSSKAGRLIKRTTDIAFASLGLIVGCPLLLAIAVTVRASMRSTVLFRQTRTGLDGRLFRLYKFRTMTDARTRDGGTLPDQQRLTAVGRFLRRASLDELPQLWNVLRGDMSLVGPRPLLPEYLPLYNPRQRRRQEVKPGITGWAQVNGRNTLSWEEKFERDVWYVDNQSFALDLRILWLTVKQMLARDGVSHPGHATMPNFTGSMQDQ